MKRTLLFAILLVLFFVPCLAQTNSQNSISTPQARKFDESTYSLYKYDNFFKTLERFAETLRKHPTAKAYIIAYDKPLTYECDHSANTLLIWAKGYLEYTKRIASNRIVVLEGGFREDLTVEVFIVPRGATPPVSIPAFEDNKAIRCQCQGYVYEPNFVFENSNSPLRFYYDWIGQKESKLKPFHKWTVSDGRIISGQGTHSILVERPATGYKGITATVELEGLSDKCKLKPASATSRKDLLPLPLKVDGFSRVSYDQLTGRLDQIVWALQSEPKTEAYIIAYNGKGDRRNLAAAQLIRMSNYLVKIRELPSDRIKVLEGGFRENFTVEVWLIEKGKTLPVPTSTVNVKAVKLKN